MEGTLGLWGIKSYFVNRIWFIANPNYLYSQGEPAPFCSWPFGQRGLDLRKYKYF